MTIHDILDALRELPLGEKYYVATALRDMISEDSKALYKERPCEHPPHRRREQRRGDRSIDVVCGKCGKVVDYYE